MKKFNYLSIVKTVFTFILLFTIATACSNSASSGDHDHSEPDGFRLKINGQTVIEQLPEQNITGEFELAPGEETPLISIYFLDHDEDEFHPEEDEYSLGYEFSDLGIAEFEHAEDGKWSFQLRGEVADTTNLTLFLNHGGHPDFTSKRIPIYVNEAE